jgi:exonuclease VII small subunit
MPGEVNPREQELSRGIVELDPFSGVDRARVKQIMKDDEEREIFDFEKDNVTGLSEEDFERLVQERYSRVEMLKDKEKLENQIKQLNDHIQHLENQFNDLDE